MGVCTRTKAPSRVPMSKTWSGEQKDGLLCQPEQHEVARPPESPAKSSEATEEYRRKWSISSVARGMPKDQWINSGGQSMG